MGEAWGGRPPFPPPPQEQITLGGGESKKKPLKLPDFTPKDFPIVRQKVIIPEINRKTFPACGELNIYRNHWEGGEKNKY